MVFGQQRTCADYKVGTFADKDRNLILERTHKKQIERNVQYGIKLEWDVVWESQCNFLLVLTGANSVNKSFLIGDTVRVKIVKLLANGYNFEANYEGHIINDVVYKIDIDSLVNKEYYKNGTLKLEYPGIKNEPNGLLKMYYMNGQVQRELMFKQGKQDGISKTYFPSGSLEKVMTFRNGEQVDTMKIYYENGKLHELSFTANGAKNGIYKLYYNTGQLQLDGFTKDGTIHGFCTHYYENGKVEKKGEYDNGTPIGIWKEYNQIGVTQKNYGKARKE